MYLGYWCYLFYFSLLPIATPRLAFNVIFVAVTVLTVGIAKIHCNDTDMQGEGDILIALLSPSCSHERQDCKGWAVLQTTTIYWGIITIVCEEDISQGKWQIFQSSHNFIRTCEIDFNCHLLQLVALFSWGRFALRCVASSLYNISGSIALWKAIRQT